MLSKLQRNDLNRSDIPCCDRAAPKPPRWNLIPPLYKSLSRPFAGMMMSVLVFHSQTRVMTQTIWSVSFSPGPGGGVTLYMLYYRVYKTVRDGLKSFQVTFIENNFIIKTVLSIEIKCSTTSQDFHNIITFSWEVSFTKLMLRCNNNRILMD